MEDFDLFNEPIQHEREVVTQLHPGDHYETAEKDGYVTSGQFLYETTGLGLGGRVSYVPGPADQESFFTRPQRIGRSIARLIGLGSLLPQPVYCHRDGMPVTIDTNPHEPRRPGQILTGFRVEGQDIKSLEITTGGSAVWQKIYNVPYAVQDTGYIRPHDFDWPAAALHFHDLCLFVRHKINTPLTITERWADATPAQKEAMSTRGLDIKVEDNRVRIVSGMAGMRIYIPRLNET